MFCTCWETQQVANKHLSKYVSDNFFLSFFFKMKQHVNHVDELLPLPKSFSLQVFLLPGGWWKSMKILHIRWYSQVSTHRHIWNSCINITVDVRPSSHQIIGFYTWKPATCHHLHRFFILLVGLQLEKHTINQPKLPSQNMQTKILLRNYIKKEQKSQPQKYMEMDQYIHDVF